MWYQVNYYGLDVLYMETIKSIIYIFVWPLNKTYIGVRLVSKVNSHLVVL